jgi:hypothetical protein
LTVQRRACKLTRGARSHKIPARPRNSSAEGAAPSSTRHTLAHTGPGAARLPARAAPVRIREPGSACQQQQRQQRARRRGALQRRPPGARRLAVQVVVVVGCCRAGEAGRGGGGAAGGGLRAGRVGEPARGGRGRLSLSACAYARQAASQGRGPAAGAGAIGRQARRRQGAAHRARRAPEVAAEAAALLQRLRKRLVLADVAVADRPARGARRGGRM